MQERKRIDKSAMENLFELAFNSLMYETFIIGLARDSEFKQGIKAQREVTERLNALFGLLNIRHKVKVVKSQEKARDLLSDYNGPLCLSDIVMLPVRNYYGDVTCDLLMYFFLSVCEFAHTNFLTDALLITYNELAEKLLIPQNLKPLSFKKNPHSLDDLKKYILDEWSIYPNSVFIVHGSNHTYRTIVDDFLTHECGLNTVILEEHSYSGRTISEKFESVADSCDYAIFLFTGDDDLLDKSCGTPSTRVRQNVLVELGYFWAKLGREKIAILLEVSKRIDIPTDIQGIGWIELTNDLKETKRKLKSELIAAGIL